MWKASMKRSSLLNTHVSSRVYSGHPVNAMWRELAWSSHCWSFVFPVFTFFFLINFSVLCKGSSFPFREHVGTICKICSFVRIHKGPETEAINQNFKTENVKVKDFAMSTNKKTLYNLYRKQTFTFLSFVQFGFIYMTEFATHVIVHIPYIWLYLIYVYNTIYYKYSYF